MADPESSGSPQIKLIYECVRGFRERDMDIITSTMHKDYRYISYPRSLGKPEENREAWVERFAGVISLWTGDGPEVNYIGYSSDPLPRD